MAMKLPRPLKGWRVLAGEVGTIVLGVLIALGAQEFVQSLHWNREVRETRKALDAELARDLAVFEQRYRNRGCVADRLTELSRWADSLFAGTPPRLKHDIEEPPFFLVRTAAWEVTDGEIASRIPLEAKLNYAAFYDGLRQYTELKKIESDAWAKIYQYGSASRLDPADFRVIKGALKDIADANQAMEPFRTAFDRFSRALAISPQTSLEGAHSPMFQQWQREACAPLL
jgi:hypothetical protein